jgi:hypothetical protein
MKTFALAALTLLAAACDRPPLPDDGLVPVTANEVCMVNDRHMASPQLPIVVAGRTYFGCCAGCVKRLTDDPGARTGWDPHTRRPVDKASAFVVKQPTGAVLYFETASTFAAYRSREQ